MKKIFLIFVFAILFFSACDPSKDSFITINHDKCIGATCRICEKVCPEDAIHFMGKDNMPIVDPLKCTNCGICIKECPTQAITGVIRQ